jgi:type I restriction enzyme S subunit
MGSEWKTYRLDELCEFINGFAFKSTDYVLPFADTIEVFRMGYIQRGGGFKEDDRPVFVPRKYGKNLEKFLLHAGDVTIAMTDMKDRVAILANTAWIRDSGRFVMNQRVGCMRVKRHDLLEPRFLYFYSNWLPHVAYLRSRANSGVQVNLSTSAIKESNLTVPPLAEQREIAAVLGALDDKIELNRRMNATLEAMARALFQTCFIDFDPVRAKLDSRVPAALDPDTAALFPEHLEDSPLGKKPIGWDVTALEDVLAVLETGGRPKGGVGGITSGVPSIGAESIVKLGVFDFAKTKFVPVEFHEGMKKGHIESRDVLLYKDGGRPGEYEPHVSMFGDGFPFEKCSINEHVYRLRANERLSQEYLYFWMTSEFTLAEMRIKGTGVAIPGLNSTAVRSLGVLVPPRPIVDAFTRHAAPLITRLLSNAKQSSTLATLRDTLLPKLLSGELDVSIISKAVA